MDLVVSPFLAWCEKWPLSIISRRNTFTTHSKNLSNERRQTDAVVRNPARDSTESNESNVKRYLLEFFLSK
jgi:hypothetical protein